MNGECFLILEVQVYLIAKLSLFLTIIQPTDLNNVLTSFPAEAVYLVAVFYDYVTGISVQGSPRLKYLRLFLGLVLSEHMSPYPS